MNLSSWTVPVLLLLLTVTECQEIYFGEWSGPAEQRLVETIAENDLSRRIYAEVVSQLRQNDVPAEFVYQTFSYPDIQIENEVVDRINNPMENLPYDRYREIFITDERISMGKKFYHEHRDIISTVEDSFEVDPFLLTSIMGVETKYGTKVSRYPVFNSLHTIIHKIPRREKWVQKEMIEYLEYCYLNFIPPHTIHGSYAGAFGYGQFIPSSFNRFSVDFDGDGVRRPFDWPDALASTANYLIQNGYVKGSRDFSKSSPNWRAVLAYNRSVNYVAVVLELREELKSALGD